MHYTKEILKQFVSESKKYLETIEDDLYELEKHKHKPDTLLVDKIFRVHHTIKEGASFLGLKNINDLALVMENMLSMIRAGEIKPEPVIVNALLEGADSLNSLLDDVHHSNEADISPVYKQLSDLLSGEVSEKVRKELDTSVPLSDLKGQRTGFEIDQFTLKNLTARHKSLYVLKFDLMELSKKENKTPLQLIRHLLAKGEIIEGRLKAILEDLHAGLPRQPLIYELLYSTTLDSGQLHDYITLPGTSITTVKPPSQGKEAPGSYFPLEMFRDHILPALCEGFGRLDLQQSQRPQIRIWSVGASSGLELYILALLVYEYVTSHKPGISLKDISILSTDTSPETLSRAIMGKYSEIEVDHVLSPEKKSRYFRRSGSTWVIQDRIRSMIMFRQVNLTAPSSFPGNFDMIVCFNSLKSFDMTTRKKIIKQFHAGLSEEGFLFPGTGGYMNELAGRFEPLKYGETIVYKKTKRNKV